MDPSGVDPVWLGITGAALATLLGLVLSAWRRRGRGGTRKGGGDNSVW